MYVCMYVCVCVWIQVVRDEDFAEVIEPGEYAVYVGGHQPTDTKAVGNILAGSFVVVGSITPLNSC